MGMYTEIFVNVELKRGVDDEAVSILRSLFDPDFDSEREHQDFDDLIRGLFGPRGPFIGHSGSYYFQPKPTSQMWYDSIGSCWHICSRSDFKNYGGEIENFFAWLQDYVEAPEGDFIGYHRYEEDALPKVVTKVNSYS